MARTHDDSQGATATSTGDAGRWSALAADDRAQTVHDYAFGVSIFLLAAVFVVAFVPGVTTPYATGITETEQEHSEAVARTLVANFSTDGKTSDLNRSRMRAFFTRDWDEPELQFRLGLPADAGVNVTLREPTLNSDVVSDFQVGKRYRGRSAATTVRVVTIDDEVYRLEVRAW
jgi:hypothetical protein